MGTGEKMKPPTDDERAKMITAWRADEIDRVEDRIRGGFIPTSLHEYNLLMDAIAALRVHRALTDPRDV